MTGPILSVPIFRAQNAAGLADAGDLLQFYVTGTTTPAPTYTTSSLGTPNANPVVADSTGLFPPIFLDPTVSYRCQWKTAGGSLIQDVDPAFQATSSGVTSYNTRTGAVTATSADITGALTYTPVNKAGDTVTGLNLTLGATPATNAAGFLLTRPTTKNAIGTYALSDLGSTWVHTDATGYAWTIPPKSSVSWPAGSNFLGRNSGSGVITLTRGAGVTLRIDGSATSKDVAVAQWGRFALFWEADDVWSVAGTGLS